VASSSPAAALTAPNGSHRLQVPVALDGGWWDNGKPPFYPLSSIIYEWSSIVIHGYHPFMGMFGR